MARIRRCRSDSTKPTELHFYASLSYGGLQRLELARTQEKDQIVTID